MAHARMLGSRILPGDMDSILMACELLAALEDGELRFDEALEDVHTNVEVALTERIGESGSRCTRPAAVMPGGDGLPHVLRELLLETCGY
jgi:argininosuccinate lyase